jgi:hypothetical protein
VKDVMTLSPRLRKTALPLLALALVALTGVALRYFAPLPPAVMMAWTGLVIASASVISVLCWRALDEVARDAHKTSWYWGGSFGLLIAFLAYIAADKVNPDLLVTLARGSEPTDFIGLGLLVTIMAQLVGYLIVWAGWWFVRR